MLSFILQVLNMSKYKTTIFLIITVFLIALVLKAPSFYKQYHIESQHNAAMDLLCAELSKETKYDVVQRRSGVPNNPNAPKVSGLSRGLRELALQHADIFNAHSYDEPNHVKITLMKHVNKREYAKILQYKFNRIMERYRIPISLPYIKIKNAERTIKVLVWNCNESNNVSELKDAINRIEGIPNTIGIEVTNIESIWSIWKDMNDNKDIDHTR